MAFDNTNTGNYQKTQESIVRQSSLKFVVEYCELNNLQLSLMETLRITNWITNYCLNGSTEDLERNIKAIDEHIAKKKSKPTKKDVTTSKLNGMEKDFTNKLETILEKQ